MGRVRLSSRSCCVGSSWWWSCAVVVAGCGGQAGGGHHVGPRSSTQRSIQGALGGNGPLRKPVDSNPCRRPYRRAVGAPPPTRGTCGSSPATFGGRVQRRCTVPLGLRLVAPRGPTWSAGRRQPTAATFNGPTPTGNHPASTAQELPLERVEHENHHLSPAGRGKPGDQQGSGTTRGIPCGLWAHIDSTLRRRAQRSTFTARRATFEVDAYYTLTVTRNKPRPRRSQHAVASSDGRATASKGPASGLWQLGDKVALFTAASKVHGRPHQRPPITRTSTNHKKPLRWIPIQSRHIRGCTRLSPRPRGPRSSAATGPVQDPVAKGPHLVGPRRRPSLHWSTGVSRVRVRWPGSPGPSRCSRSLNFTPLEVGNLNPLLVEDAPARRLYWIARAPPSCLLPLEMADRLPSWRWWRLRNNPVVAFVGERPTPGPEGG